MIKKKKKKREKKHIQQICVFLIKSCKQFCILQKKQKKKNSQFKGTNIKPQQSSSLTWDICWLMALNLLMFCDNKCAKDILKFVLDILKHETVFEEESV